MKIILTYLLDMDIKEIAKQLGSLGGKKTSEKYGKDYYRELQRKSTEAKKNKKK